MGKIKNIIVTIGKYTGRILCFDKPAIALLIFAVATGILWVLQAALFQKILPLDVIEAIVWGNQMQLGQMKSPPLSGYLAYGAFMLSGGQDWSLYLLDQLTVFCGIFFIYKLGREFFDEYGAATGAMLVFFLIYYMPPAMKFCSHSTQYAFMPAMAFFFYRAYRNNNWRDWIGVAIFSALAVLGKYSAFQLLLAFGVVMIFTADGRKLFASAKPYVAGIVFLLLLAPHIVWLFQHDFLPVFHLEDRTGLKINWYDPLDTLAIFIYPYAVLTALCFVAALPWRGKERKKIDPAILKYLLPVSLIPPAIYLILSFSGHSTVDQWFSYMCSFSGLVAVAITPYQCDGKIFRRIAGAAWLYFLLLLIITVIDVTGKPRFKIHTDKQDIIAAFEEFRTVADGKKLPVEVVYGDRYVAGVLEIYHPDHPSCCAAEDICSWELAEERAYNGGVVLVDVREAPCRKFLAIPPEVELIPREYTIKFRSQSGKERKKKINFIYLPPKVVGKP